MLTGTVHEVVVNPREELRGEGGGGEGGRGGGGEGGV